MFGKLDEPREISIRAYREKVSGTVAGYFSLLQMFSSFVTSAYVPVYEKSDFESHVLSEIQKAYPDEGYLGLELKKDLSAELRTYGFLEWTEHQLEYPFRQSDYQFTQRLYRFVFWLEVNNLHGDTPLFDITQTNEKSQTSKQSG